MGATRLRAPLTVLDYQPCRDTRRNDRRGDWTVRLPVRAIHPRLLLLVVAGDLSGVISVAGPPPATRAESRHDGQFHRSPPSRGPSMLARRSRAWREWASRSVLWGGSGGRGGSASRSRRARRQARPMATVRPRSEEHTSELQSQSN